MKPQEFGFRVWGLGFEDRKLLNSMHRKRKDKMPCKSFVRFGFRVCGLGFTTFAGVRG